MREEAVVACLCAGWCRLCDDYAPVLREVAAEFPGLRTRWIDIEDEAELVGEIDVETFPTLVIVSGGELRFAGPLTPQPDTLRRVLRAALADDARRIAGAAGYDALASRLAGD
ncbi:co-chaperone YbbN [Pelomonas sp. KK5]|uniref:thioredoxin family protein n=1 Tax=Pelomonas sp. KK5 TaxID=1855730 RepID=UPI001E2B755D|nr:thioredoxin family protein [Pelomonas sp. KK5]